MLLQKDMVFEIPNTISCLSPFVPLWQFDIFGVDDACVRI